jgi:hypothetical protein
LDKSKEKERKSARKVVYIVDAPCGRINGSDSAIFIHQLVGSRVRYCALSSEIRGAGDVVQTCREYEDLTKDEETPGEERWRILRGDKYAKR